MKILNAYRNQENTVFIRPTNEVDQPWIKVDNNDDRFMLMPEINLDHIEPYKVVSVIVEIVDSIKHNG